jgi:hypothetical protein
MKVESSRSCHPNVQFGKVLRFVESSMPILFPLIRGTRSRMLNRKPVVTVGIDESDYHIICGSRLDPLRISYKH